MSLIRFDEYLNRIRQKTEVQPVVENAQPTEVQETPVEKLEKKPRKKRKKKQQ